MTYKNLLMNLSEWPEARIGTVDLIAINSKGERLCRRTLYRRA
jgi:hypothetical protein